MLKQGLPIQFLAPGGLCRNLNIVLLFACQESMISGGGRGSWLSVILVRSLFVGLGRTMYILLRCTSQYRTEDLAPMPKGYVCITLAFKVTCYVDLISRLHSWCWHGRCFAAPPPLEDLIRLHSGSGSGSNERRGLGKRFYSVEQLRKCYSAMIKYNACKIGGVN